ncbi:tyrosine-type recombinase/integrase [Falsihalocynthiibacter sp. CO-5D18]|uniref:tyrosine-type recombinase/integrase n=1 Tax=Falsihalocynthiibacter sp. CO-5D18 TaxID=3240872 RepID=UPI00350F85EE
MPRIANELSALEVRRLKHLGKGRNVTFAVGGVSGLYLQVTPNDGRTWLLRAKVGDIRREIGLGGYPDVTLAMARERARDAKDQIRRGIDPVEERKAAKASLIAAQRRGLTFADAVGEYLAAKLDAFKNPKHRQQWRNTLTTYALPQIGFMLVQDITVQDILRVLEPIWRSKTETASRLRGRIEAVLSWATVAGHRAGDNPARWAGNLKELLPARSKVAKVGNHPALQIDDAPRWLAALREREGMSNRALEFAALTATRSQEVRGARWDEFCTEAGLWIIPAERMKMDREHRVPLSKYALRLLEVLPRFEDNTLVFPAPRGGELSDMSLSAAMKKLHKKEIETGGIGFLDRVSKRPAVSHGLRSTFRDWVAERTHYPGEMAELALAHRISNSVEASYRRGDMIERRRAMMTEWAAHLRGQDATAAQVVNLI